MFNFLMAWVLISAVAHMVADHKQQWSWTYIFKPLTMLLIISIVVLYADLSFTSVRYIVIGLVLSLVGDIFLMLRPQKFLPGLVSFLLAHLSYIAAFFEWHSATGISIGGAFESVLLWSVVLIAGMYLVAMWRDLGKLKLAVMCYVFAISLMVVLALNLVFASVPVNEGYEARVLIAIGSVLFAVSDATLGYRKFKQDFKQAQTVIMSTYFSAQLLFAWACVYISGSG